MSSAQTNLEQRIRDAAARHERSGSQEDLEELTRLRATYRKSAVLTSSRRGGPMGTVRLK